MSWVSARRQDVDDHRTDREQDYQERRFRGGFGVPALLLAMETQCEKHTADGEKTGARIPPG